MGINENCFLELSQNVRHLQKDCDQATNYFDVIL